VANASFQLVTVLLNQYKVLLYCHKKCVAATGKWRLNKSQAFKDLHGLRWRKRPLVPLNIQEQKNVLQVYNIDLQQ